MSLYGKRGLKLKIAESFQVSKPTISRKSGQKLPHFNLFICKIFQLLRGHIPLRLPLRARLTQNKCIIFDFQKRLSFGNEGRTATQNRPISICYLQIFPTSEGEHPPQTPPAVLEASIVEDIILSAKEELESKRKNRRKNGGKQTRP